MEPASKRATYQDLLDLPEDVRAEIIAGGIETAPSPLPEHAWATGALGRFVGGPYGHDHGRGGPGGWWILADIDVRLGVNDIVRPDVSGWRRERLPQPWGTRPIDVVPDWICEVVSPSNAAYDRVTKSALYAKHGVAHYWLADVAQRVLERLRLSDDVWIRAGSYDESSIARIEPFGEIELEVGLLFPPHTDV